MKKNILLIALVFLFSASITDADEVSDLKQEVNGLEKKIAAIETAQSRQTDMIEIAVADAIKDGRPEAVTVGDVKWSEKISFYGDFRLRYDMLENDKDDYTRQRGRMRVRVGMKAVVNDEVSFDLRLATGGESYGSGNQTFDGYSSKKEFMLDRAYITYKPSGLEGFSIKGGKMGVPFYKPNNSQLIWDGDLNLEGIALSGEMESVFVNLGGFVIDEEKTTNDGLLYGAQIGVRFDLAGMKNTVGLGSINYSDVELDANDNNNFDADGAIIEENAAEADLNIFEVFFESAFDISGVPVVFYGNYARNSEAADNDTGYLLGVSYGEANAPGAWRLGYEYLDIEANAVYDPYNDSDFLDSHYGTGHKFGFDIGLLKNTSLSLAYLLGNYDNALGYSDDDFQRFIVDFKFKF